MVAMEGMETSGTAGLIGVSSIMLFGAYIAGLLPAVMKLSNPKHLQLINASGAGLLLGAALCVVLPEGFFAFMEAQASQTGERYPDWVPGLVLLLGFLSMMGLQVVAETMSQGRNDGSKRVNHHPSSIKENGDVDASGASAVGYGDDEEDQLLLSTSSTLVARESASVLERGRCPYAESDSDILGPSEQALYGLVVHSAADGLAVGAACLSGSLALTASVGSAILIHKFPVAFGLSSFLRGSGWEGWRLQRGLLMFCAAAPVTAVFTFAVLGHLTALSNPRNIALCVLFSGGTVLHAGLVHVLPSVLPPHPHSHPSSHSSHSSSAAGGAGHHHHRDGHLAGGSLGCASAGDEGARGAGGLMTGGKPSSRLPASGSVMAVLVVSSLLPLIISALVPE